VTPTYKWVGNERKDGGTDVWKLIIDRRLRYSITYLGRTRAANWADTKMRWKVQNHSIVEFAEDIPEFFDLDEAKAWVEAVVRLDP
jgi:hypothetical protein